MVYQEIFNVNLHQTIYFSLQVKPTCIYGMSETPVIGGNNLFFQDSRGAHTIKMQMNFTWPVSGPIYSEHDKPMRTSKIKLIN